MKIYDVKDVFDQAIPGRGPVTTTLGQWHCDNNDV
jgi:hypothetical protein